MFLQDDVNPLSFIPIIVCLFFILAYFFTGVIVYSKQETQSIYQKAIDIINHSGNCYIGDKKCEDMVLCKKLLDERPFMITNNKELKIFEIP